MKKSTINWKSIYHCLLVKEIIIIAVCAFMGVAALAVTYLLSQDAMRENVQQSSIILYNEGLGIQLWEGIEETMLDTYTDGLLLNVSYTVTDDGLNDILLDTWVEVDGTNPMNSFYEVNVLSNDNHIVKTYGRYWHGYQTILRPLLLFFTYSDIRQINMILQLTLVFVIICLLSESGNKKFILSFFGMYIFLSPVSLFSSLQYSPCFYIMMFALIALFGLQRYFNDTTRNYVFLMAGILTAYFDLLTYPLITLAVPLIAYLGSDCDRFINTKNRGVKNILCYSASWLIGYVGMWSSKWIIASILTEENIICDALEQIKFRSGHFTEGYTYIDTLKLNLGTCNRNVFLIMVICLAVYMLALTIKNRTRINKKLLSCMGMILFVSLYPFIWYFLTKNHSSGHSYFTYRELATSIFGVLTIVSINTETTIR